MNKLLIVESPTKAKTISKYLGNEYTVLSSFGHIRDLPKSKLGVDVEHDFAPTYIVPPKSKPHVVELKQAVKKVDEVYLATDEDREGEAIAWHLAEVLGLDPSEAKRITFHEITKDAIAHAVANPRNIDENLVNAQQARRILDRLVGYELSPFLWQKVRRGLSAGRVQSVAMRLIVERERERQAFKIDEFWTIDGMFKKDSTEFPGKLEKIGDTKLDKLSIKTSDEAKLIVESLKGATATVESIEEKQMKKSSPTPFTTSTLQIDANTKLGMSAKTTMRLAQQLYETGRITYMRTDSMNLAEKFLAEAQTYIKSNFGERYAQGPRRYHTNKKGAQEAHEAIRPTNVDASPSSLKAELEPRAWKLYDLIWRRTLASQLPPAELNRTVVDLVAVVDQKIQNAKMPKIQTYTFRANGSTIIFDGFMKIYQSAKEKILPALAKDDAVETTSIVPTQHFTEPPPRYSDATLVKTLEEFGIGRPSTYAPTITTIIDRGYVLRDDNKKLAPTDVAMIVCDVLVKNFHSIIDYDFTAKMEGTLDDIADGKAEWIPTLRAFYDPFHKNLAEKTKSVKREDIMPDRVLGQDTATGLPIIAKTGRFGAFVQVGEYSKADKDSGKPKPKSASLLKGMTIESLTLDEALACLSFPKTLGKNQNGEDVLAAIGRFGPYVKAGEVSTSIKEPLSPATITLELAIELLKNAGELKKKMQTPIAVFGLDPETGGEIILKHGRFGPYLTDGKTNASLGRKRAPEEITRELAIEILAKKRAAPPSKRRK
jgi:DNA topoisomerase-1